MPKILIKNINILTIKIKFLLLIDNFPKKFVKTEFLFSLIFTLTSETKLIKAGNKLKVTMNETIKPRVIIQPKSIIGLISLKINERNAQIVVRTV